MGISLPSPLCLSWLAGCDCVQVTHFFNNKRKRHKKVPAEPGRLEALTPALRASLNSFLVEHRAEAEALDDAELDSPPTSPDASPHGPQPLRLSSSSSSSSSVAQGPPAVSCAITGAAATSWPLPASLGLGQPAPHCYSRSKPLRFAVPWSDADNERLVMAIAVCGISDWARVATAAAALHTHPGVLGFRLAVRNPAPT